MRVYVWLGLAGLLTLSALLLVASPRGLDTWRTVAFPALDPGLLGKVEARMKELAPRNLRRLLPDPSW